VEHLLSHITLLDGDEVLLHESITRLSQHFHTERFAHFLGNGTVLFSERVVDGFHCLLKNTSNIDGNLDIELFFKAIAEDPSILNYTSP